MNSDHIFIGIEAEGERRGLRTLFIPKGGVKNVRGVNKVVNIIEADNNLKQIYFGAGDHQGVDSVDVELISLLLVLFPIPITIEIVQSSNLNIIPTRILERVNIVMTIPTQNTYGYLHINAVKFVDHTRLVWVDIKSKRVTITSIHDKQYLVDKEV